MSTPDIERLLASVPTGIWIGGEERSTSSSFDVLDPSNDDALRRLFGTSSLLVLDSSERVVFGGRDVLRNGLSTARRAAASVGSRPSGVFADLGGSTVGWSKLPTTDWLIVVERDRDELFSTAEAQFERSLTLLVGLCLLSVFGAGLAAWRLDRVHVREAQSFHGRQYVRVDAGWLPATALQRPEVPDNPSDLRGEERWVDVDRAHQTLVAFEGTRPVFATLVSTGRPGNPTAPGEHRVWVKLATTDMSNVDNVDLYSATSLYTVSRVPWVMFFHNDQALHGAFWHDRFGAAHSHGCVNLAPRDAAWIYSWAPPAAPPGWTAVMPTATDPGLRVRVR